ncbi:hypothetical protein V6N13_059125 [Hibiscus sabdariffa]
MKSKGHAGLRLSNKPKLKSGKERGEPSPQKPSTDEPSNRASREGANLLLTKWVPCLDHGRRGRWLPANPPQGSIEINHQWEKRKVEKLKKKGKKGNIERKDLKTEMERSTT